MKLLKIALLGLACATSTQAAAQFNTQQSHYLNKFGLNVFQDAQNEMLVDLTLKTALTDQGVVYYNQEREVFFNNVQPMYFNGAELDLVDKPFYDYVVSNIPDTIDKKAENERLLVTVFTDITCGWCQKLHEQVDEYLALGVSFRFVLYPAGGLGSNSALMMSQIMNSEDRFETMQRVFKEQYITPSIEMHPAVKNNFITGQMLNVTGTPQMFVNGYPYSGYLPPKQLVKIFVNPNG